MSDIEFGLIVGFFIGVVFFALLFKITEVLNRVIPKAGKKPLKGGIQ